MAEPFTIYKLTILNMLDKVDFPLTNTQISNFFLEQDYIPSDATITKVTIDADTVEGGQPHIEHGAMRPRYKSLTEQQ